MLKHRILLCLIYSAGLRLKEVRFLQQRDIDFDRMQIHIRKTKYRKERYVPLSVLMAKGLKKYYEAYKPKVYVFNGKKMNSPLSGAYDVATVWETWPYTHCYQLGTLYL